MTTEDTVPYEHDAGEPLTAGDLRRALDGIPDDTTMMVRVTSEPWSGRSEVYVADATEFRAGGFLGAAFLVSGGPMSGVFLRPRPARLVVEHGESADAEALGRLEQLRLDVKDAVAATGYRGPSSCTPGPTSTWEWESTGDVDVAVVLTAAAAAAQRLDPGTWHITADTA